MRLPRALAPIQCGNSRPRAHVGGPSRRAAAHTGGKQERSRGPASSLHCRRPSHLTCLYTWLRFWLYLSALLQMSSKSRASSCHVRYCRPWILPRITCEWAGGATRTLRSAGDKGCTAPAVAPTATVAGAVPGQLQGSRCSTHAAVGQPSESQRSRRLFPSLGGLPLVERAEHPASAAPTSKHMGCLMIL